MYSKLHIRATLGICKLTDISTICKAHLRLHARLCCSITSCLMLPPSVSDAESQLQTKCCTCRPLPEAADRPTLTEEAEELLRGPFYAFPTLQQLSEATEEELRAAGFGYR